MAERVKLTEAGEPLHLMHHFGRKCDHCGRMLWPGMLGAAPRWTEDRAGWSAAADNCRQALKDQTNED
jgi:hypothetical protein